MNLVFKDENGNVIGQQEQPVEQEVVVQVEQPVEQQEPVEQAPEDIDDQKVRAYLKERYEIESIEDVLRQPEPLPEDVDAFLKYKKQTGRTFEDYINLQKDWSKVDDTSLLKQYYRETSPHLDDEDISYLIEDNFSYDEDIDDSKDIKKKKVAIKDELFKAKSYFESQKEKYKAPLVSSEADLPEQYKEAYSFYSEYNEQSKKEAQLQEERSKFFLEKTEGIFNEEFKGFEFDLGEKKQLFELKDVGRVKSEQSDITNFFNKHIDEKGYIKDAASYHKALFAAANADAMARYFYEQGKADAIEDVVRETKNISMSVRDNKPVEVKGLRFREVDGPSGNSLKFKK
jgi:hypothetical protein